MGDLNIVLDVFSGSIHVVDDIAYDIIGMYEKCSAEILSRYGDREGVNEDEIRECLSQIGELKAAGQLFAPDTFAPMAGKLKEKTSGVVKALCLHIAHTCNLNCSYCFASQGKFRGERAVMRGGAASQFRGGKTACRIRAVDRGGEREELPLHPHDERYTYRRQRHRLLQQGNEQRRSQP